MTEERLTIDERVLFTKIANDIKNNPTDYHEAGKWLDEYCTKDSFCERTKEDKKKWEDDIKEGFPAEGALEMTKYMLEADIYLSPYDVMLNEDGEEDVEATKRIIENSKVGYRLYLYLYTWRDTIWHLIGNWDTKINLGIENSRRVLLITWLLIRPDLEADSPELNISKFEKMPSEKTHSLYSDTFDLRQRRGQQWMEAIKVAWQTVKIDRETVTQSPPSSEEPTETDQNAKFHKPKAENWQQITIEVVDNDTVKFKVNDNNWERANYTQLGFLDRRKNRPDKLWPIFLGLASKNLPTGINRPKMKPKDIDRIRYKLRKFFGIKKLPIKYNRKAKEYRCNFTFTDPRDWKTIPQNENRVD
jgi:hypothetical protein